MKGAEDEPIRDNPTVHSKFNRSHGKGVSAPHMSSPGPVMPTTSPGPRVYSQPKNVGSSGSMKTQHIPPSQLGDGMANGRHYAQAPNMAQTQMQGKSSSVAPSNMARGGMETPSGRDPVKSAVQRDTAASTRLGTQMPYRSTKVTSDNRVTKVSSKQGPGVLAGTKRL